MVEVFLTTRRLGDMKYSRNPCENQKKAKGGQKSRERVRVNCTVEITKAKHVSEDKLKIFIPCECNQFVQLNI